MFDEPHPTQVGDRMLSLSLNTSSGERPEEIFQVWAAQLARVVLKFGVYFKTVGFFLRLPGAGTYDPSAITTDTEDPVWKLAEESRRDMLIKVLEECLKRLGVADLIAELPVEKSHVKELNKPWKKLIARMARRDSGLLAIIAACLDKLVIEPGMDEIVGHPWWQRSQSTSSCR